jgi:regulatory protein
MHSSFELYQKLTKKKFEKHLVHEVLQTLKENRLLNDKEFAERFCVESFYHKKIGKNKIRMLLKQRGIALPLIEEGLQKIDQADSETGSPLEAVARKKLKQLRGRNIDGRELANKLTAFLMQRGYSFTEVRAVIQKILSSDESIDEQMEN